MTLWSIIVWGCGIVRGCSKSWWTKHCPGLLRKSSGRDRWTDGVVSSGKEWQLESLVNLRLPEKDNSVWWLSYHHGYQAQQLAGSLGKPQQLSWTRWHGGVQVGSCERLRLVSWRRYFVDHDDDRCCTVSLDVYGAYHILIKNESKNIHSSGLFIILAFILHIFHCYKANSLS